MKLGFHQSFHRRLAEVRCRLCRSQTGKNLSKEPHHMQKHIAIMTPEPLSSENPWLGCSESIAEYVQVPIIVLMSATG